MNDIDQFIEEEEDEEFDEFYDLLQSFAPSEEDEEPEERSSYVPDTKIKARKWVSAYKKLKEEIDWLQKEYKPFLKEKYLNPIDKKIGQHEKALDVIKETMLEYFENCEETKLNFPDIGTMFTQKIAPQVIYPDKAQETELIDQLVKDKNTYYLKEKYTFDKPKIKEVFNFTKDAFCH